MVARMEDEMTKKLSNPFAFPVHQNDVEEGLKMRDYFAAKAMQGYMSGNMRPVEVGNGSFSNTQIAKYSYAIADAMLLEREKGGE